MNFIIDRSKWRTGDNGDNATGRSTTQLLNNEGFMCCLGMCALQLDYTKKEIIGHGEPGEGDWEVSPQDDHILTYISEGDVDESYIYSTDLSYKAMEINDNINTTLKQKEKKLTKLFKEQGHTIEFIGEPVKFKE